MGDNEKFVWMVSFNDKDGGRINTLRVNAKTGVGAMKKGIKLFNALGMPSTPYTILVATSYEVVK